MVVGLLPRGLWPRDARVSAVSVVMVGVFFQVLFDLFLFSCRLCCT